MFQNCWVVDDVEATATKWSEQLGIGPFFMNEHVDSITEVNYRGGPGEIQMITALAQAGPMQIELIQPTNEPNAYRDSVPAGSGIGFHHVCVWSHDLDADIDYMTGLGYPLANRALAGGGTAFAYLDARPLLGAMLEIVTHHPRIQALFEAIADTCSGWDGTKPLRALREL